VVCLFAEGNLLLDGVPGVGKTMLARAIAASIEGTFSRVQATPDLLPSDLTGISVYDQEAHQFRFVPGPIFANVVLVDEINRTTPRTQSARSWSPWRSDRSPWRTSPIAFPSRSC